MWKIYPITNSAKEITRYIGLFAKSSTDNKTKFLLNIFLTVNNRITKKYDEKTK